MINLKECGIIEGVSEHCWQIGVSPDGQYIALVMADDQNAIQLCSLEGKVFKRLEGHRKRIHSISFSRDGRTIASASADKTVRIWAPTGDLLALFDRFDNSVETVCYAPDVPILAGGQSDGYIVMFDIGGNYIATLHSPKGRIYCLDWSRDSSYLAAACGDKRMYLFDVKQQMKSVYPHPAAVYGVSFTHNNGKLATSCEDSNVRLFNIAEDEIDTVDIHQGRVVGIGFSPDDSFIATASFDKTIRFFDRHGNVCGEYELGEEALGLRFSLDGSKLFVNSQQQFLHIFDIET